MFNFDEIKPRLSNEILLKVSEFQTKMNECLKEDDKIKIVHGIKPNLIGKDGSVTKIMQCIKEIDNDEAKKQFAIIANDIKNHIEMCIRNKFIIIEEKEINEKLKLEAIDETLPIQNIKIGSIHIITKVAEEIINILQKYGFKLYNGPEIENCEFNFTKLNMPENHPARQMQDTFYINGKDDLILRTHTSNVQIHAMQNQNPPIRGISFGKVYRCDSDATHSPMFHQIECFCVDENVNMSHLNWIIEQMCMEFFETDLNIRFRPSFFPFTEPSAEIDISYVKNDDEIKISKSNNFLEIGGCGMIHLKVLENCKIDAQKYRGFAFGFGIERMSMLKYGISDIRELFG